MPVRRPLRALAAAALVAPTLALAAPAGAAEPLVHHHGALTDLQPRSPAPTDGATGSVSAWQTSDGTTVVLRLRGMPRDAADERYGAHVHVGDCVEGEGSKAGPHYNVTGQPPRVVSDDTEVWLDFTIGRGGTAYAVAKVPFTIPPGAARSVVVHALPTDPATGGAGGRIACLPVRF